MDIRAAVGLKPTLLGLVVFLLLGGFSYKLHIYNTFLAQTQLVNLMDMRYVRRGYEAQTIEGCPVSKACCRTFFVPCYCRAPPHDSAHTLDVVNCVLAARLAFSSNSPTAPACRRAICFKCSLHILTFRSAGGFMSGSSKRWYLIVALSPRAWWMIWYVQRRVSCAGSQGRPHHAGRYKAIGG